METKIDLIDKPYFTYTRNYSGIENHIELKEDNIEEILTRLEKRENLFKLIFGVKMKFENLGYGLFQRRKEAVFEEGKLVSESGFKQVGKLLIPFYGIITSDQMASKINEESTCLRLRENYLNALKEFPDTQKFHINPCKKDLKPKFIPFDPNSCLILYKTQL